MKRSAQQRELDKVAYDLALGYGHDHVGTEHVLLGLLSTEGDLLDALRMIGADAEQTRAILLDISFAGETFIRSDELFAEVGVDLAELSHAGADSLGEGAVKVARGMLTTVRQSQVDTIAPIEAERLGHAEVRFGHVVLAMTRQDEGARLVFARAGIEIPVLRRALMRAMEVPEEVVERYERERAAAEAASTGRGLAIKERFAAAVPDGGSLDDAIDRLLREHSQLGSQKEEDLDRLRARAAEEGFVILEGAARDARAFWVVSEPSMKQLIVMSVTEMPDGSWYAGVDDLRKLPHWLRDEDWPQR